MDHILLNNQNLLPKGMTLTTFEKALEKGVYPLKEETFETKVDITAVKEFVNSLNNEILTLFTNYLEDMGRADATALNYANKIKDVCDQCNIDVLSLYLETIYTVDDLIRMYSSSGVLAIENRRQRYTPATVLKAFEDFVIYERDY